jgi:hypothetical protein
MHSIPGIPGIDVNSVFDKKFSVPTRTLK